MSSNTSNTINNCEAGIIKYIKITKLYYNLHSK